MNASRRNVVVYCSLVGALTLTSVVLRVLSPAPLAPESSSSLFAVETVDSYDPVFQTRVPFQSQRWQSVYIHHSKTPTGSAVALAARDGQAPDHFVIGNGQGSGDGEIQLAPRWMRQLSAAPPAGARQIDPACISICLVGDFDYQPPTPAQLRRLSELLAVLQQRCNIRAEQVFFDTQALSAAGLGAKFPSRRLQAQLLP